MASGLAKNPQRCYSGSFSVSSFFSVTDVYAMIIGRLPAFIAIRAWLYWETILS
jgi:hypothetical protein